MTKELLKKLIAIPSLSGQEGEIAKFLYELLKKKGLRPKLIGRNVYFERGKGKKVLLLNTHLDTVLPTFGWKTNPYRPKEIKGKIYGLGACDAKASLVAMIAALIELQGLKINGKIIFTATGNEEAGESEFRKLIKKINYQAAVIGEPTDLDICIAQRGSVILKIISQGKPGHIALGKGVNAIYRAVEDVKILKELKFKKRDNFLEYPILQVTKIEGGVAKNIIPDSCQFVISLRSTPSYPNRYLINLIKNKIKSKIEILSERYFPKKVNINEKIVKVAQKSNPKAKVKGFLAVSDFAFVKKPAIILGPGSLRQAHCANEFVKIAQLKKAKEVYKRIIKNFFL